MADVSKIKLPSGVTYDIKDDGALPLTGGTVTGPVTFEDAVDMSDATAGDLVVNGNASFTNNVNVNTINSVAVGSSPKFTDEKIKLTSVTNDSEYPVLLGPTSITSGSTYSGDYTTDITINPNSKQLTLKSVNLYYNDTCSAILATKGYVGNSTNHIPILKFESMAANTSGTIDYYTYLSGVKTPTSDTSNYDTFVANKKYVDDKFSSIIVPTKTSDLTNDSGFVTTDEKVYVTGIIDSGATYYPILATGSGTATRQIDYYGALKYTSTAGSSSTKGTAILELGNNIASGTANNEYGVLRLYGTTTKYYDLKTYPDYPAANRTIYFPRYASNMYLTCTSSTSAVGGATTKPVYVDDTGCIKAVTSIPYSLLTGVPTVNSNTTGISISNHSTGSVTGVQSSTTTASKVTLGTAISVPNVTAVGSGSFTQGSFNGGSLTFAIDSTDNKQLNITFTAATHGADSHTHTAPTLGTAKSIPNVTGVSDVTVPIKNTSATTVVTSATHTVTDNGHTHNLS